MQAIYNKRSEQLNELVNYGSKILKTDFDTRKNNDEDIAQLSLFRHTLDIIDSISQLVKVSSTDTPIILLRNLFETLLSIEYILEKDTPRRAISYLVMERLSSIKAAKRLCSDSEASTELWKLFTSEGLLTKGEKDEDSEKHIVELEELLSNTPKYKEIIDEKKRCDRARKGKEVTWYGLFSGPVNIYELAKFLKKATHYELLYKQWSGIVHASSIHINKFVFSEEDKGHMTQLRNPRNLNIVLIYTMLFSANIFRIYIQKRVPSLIKDYVEWYIKYKENIPLL